MKKLLLIFFGIFSVAIFTFGILCITDVIDFDGNTQTPIDPPTPDVTEEKDIQIFVNKDLKTNFYVNEEIGDYKEYFNIYENLTKIEMKDEYITGIVGVEKAGEYSITCTYGEISKTVTFTIKDKIEIIKVQNSLIFDLGTENVDLKEYFKIKVNGLFIKMEDSYISSSVDFNTVGDYSITCSYNDEKMEIPVTIKEGDNNGNGGDEITPPPTETPEPTPQPTPPSDITPEIVVSENTTFIVGNKVDIDSLFVFYCNEELLTFPSYTYTTDLNIHMAGTYNVNVKLVFNYKEYSYDFDITIKELEEEMISDYEINSYKNSLIPSFRGYSSAALYSLVNDETTNTYTFKTLETNSIVFFYDSNNENDVITFAHLLKFYSEYSNNPDYNVPEISVYDINANIEASKTNPDRFIKIQETLTAYENGEYNYYINDTDIITDSMNIQGKLFVCERTDGQTTYSSLKMANRNYTYKMYTNYLKEIFKIK